MADSAAAIGAKRLRDEGRGVTCSCPRPNRAHTARRPMTDVSGEREKQKKKREEKKEVEELFGFCSWLRFSLSFSFALGLPAGVCYPHESMESCGPPLCCPRENDSARRACTGRRASGQ